MSSYVYVNPANPGQRYMTAIPNDPNVPVGYILTGTSDGSAQCVDGLTDKDEQIYQGGQWSGGYPPYSGYGDGSKTNGTL